MESNPTSATLPYFSMMGYDSSSSSDDLSTGYLEDALVRHGDKSKRKRSLQSDDTSDALAFQTYWNSTSRWEWGPLEDFNCTANIISTSFNSELSSDSRSRTYTDVLPEIQTPKEAITSSGLYEILDCSSSSFKDSSKTSSIKSNPHRVSVFSLDTVPCSPEFRGDKLRKKRVMKRLVYPFALVKPGGTEDDVTLNDINKKILMPPTRPVRHPVGDFACRPTCLSPRGPGLSGKAVVALTRIHTQGRGTITIIRTKG